MRKLNIIESLYSHINKRPFFAIAFLIITIIILNGVSPVLTMAINILLFILLAIECLTGKKDIYLLIYLSVFFVILIFSLYLSSFSKNISNAYSDFDGENITLEGRVRNIPEIKNGNIVFTVKPDTIIHNDRTFTVNEKYKILVYIKNDETIMVDFDDNISITGLMLKTSKKRYKTGFDYELNMYQKAVSAIMFVDSISKADREENEYPVLTLLRFGQNLRKRILETIYKAFPEREAGLMAGMLIGIRAGLDQDLQLAFQKSGLLHIMAVSGANILFLIAPIIFISRKLGLSKYLYISISAVCIILFVLITGFESSVVRASIMAFIFMLGKMITRRNDIYVSLSISCIIMLIINPYNLYNPGFILSYSAVLSLAIFYKPVSAAIIKSEKRYDKKIVKKMISGMGRNLKEAFSAVLSVQLGVTPISAVLFNSFSVVSIINNVLISLAVVCITVYGMFLIIYELITDIYIAAISYPCLLLLKYILFIVEYSTRFSFSKLTLITPGIGIVALYYVFSIWLFKTKAGIGKIMKTSAVGITLLMILSFSGRLFDRNDRIYFIDIDQGDSILIHTADNANILIDSGKHDGEKHLLPYLLDHGVRSLDAVVATHSHDDHITGFFDIFEYYSTGVLILPEYKDSRDDFADLIKCAAEKNIPYTFFSEGDSFYINESVFTLINPQHEMYDKEIPLNNTSIVLKYSYKDFSILFMGDLEEEFENILIDEEKDIESDVLKVGHHGSDTSTSEEFLEAVNPRAAVISVGYNTFNHPGGDVIERLKDNDILIYRTDLNSGISIKTNGRKYIIDSLY